LEHKITILAVDFGTTAMKMGIYLESDEGLNLVDNFSKSYRINIYKNGLFCDIDPIQWQDSFLAGSRYLSKWTPDIDVITLSGTTPGLTFMDCNGQATYPAILMLDQRSRKQAQRIIDVIGLNKLLATTANMPVAGGCSLASILWLKENEPEIYKNTEVFGHSNTFIARWLTGKYVIDPSSASLTDLYNTVKNDLTWNRQIADSFGLSLNRLPRLLLSHESPGRFEGSLARELGFKKEPPVIIGGNDAVLAAYSVGIENPGEVINVNGTCEISLICLSKCYPSNHYNIRAHVIPGRWLTLYVMNACGQAYEWFREVFCSEMRAEEFYKDFISQAIDRWMNLQSDVRYIPYLMGSRYSLKSLKGSFTGLNRNSSREELLVAMIRSLCEYQGEHLNEIAIKIPLKKIIYVTGGAISPSIIRAKQRWMRKCKYEYVEQSSMKGAALLGIKYIKEHYSR